MRWYALVATMFCASLQAQGDAVAPVGIDPVSSSYLLKLTGGLILVVAIIFLLAWLLKKMNFNQQSQQGLIQIVSALSIGTRDRILLVQVGEEQILLGLTPGRIEKLHSLASLIEFSATIDSKPSFASKLNSLMGEGDKQ